MSIAISQVKNLSPVFDNFSKFIAENADNITPTQFSKEVTNIQKSSIRELGRDEFCAQANIIAKDLVGKDKLDFASIIYSTLCKITEFFPEQLETFAKEGYKIAEAKGDLVHMMARLNNLRKVYYRRPDKVFQYIQVLKKQESCLLKIIQNYDRVRTSGNYIIKSPAKKEQYEQMLGFVQTELAKLTKRKHPEQALQRLYSAKQIFEQSGNTRHLQYIDMLISETLKLTQKHSN